MQGLLVYRQGAWKTNDKINLLKSHIKGDKRLVGESKLCMQSLFILYQCSLQREGSSHLCELGLSRLIDGTLWQEELPTAYSVLNCSSVNCFISCVLETNKSLWQQQQ